MRVYPIHGDPEEGSQPDPLHLVLGEPLLRPVIELGAPYLAMLNLAIDRKLQRCEVVSSRMDDVAIEPGVGGVISVSGRMGESQPAGVSRFGRRTKLREG